MRMDIEPQQAEIGELVDGERDHPGWGPEVKQIGDLRSQSDDLPDWIEIADKEHESDGETRRQSNPFRRLFQSSCSGDDDRRSGCLTRQQPCDQWDAELERI